MFSIVLYFLINSVAVFFQIHFIQGILSELSQTKDSQSTIYFGSNQYSFKKSILLVFLNLCGSVMVIFHESKNCLRSLSDDNILMLISLVFLNFFTKE
jgi:hypothetical protein